MPVTTIDLSSKHCKSCEGGAPPLQKDDADSFLSTVPGWYYESGCISKIFNFKNFYHTMAFVNAVAWIAHCESHHPEMEISYNTCRISYTTHAAGGLTENDFICAAKVNALQQGT